MGASLFNEDGAAKQDLAGSKDYVKKRLARNKYEPPSRKVGQITGEA